LNELIDSHIHLDDERFAEDRSQLISEALKAGVSQFIVPAVSLSRFAAVTELEAQHPQVEYALGLHPYYLSEHQPEDLEILQEQLTQSSAIAVGECGLDHHLKNLDRDRQLHFFESQVKLAKNLDLPLILHVRGAVDAVFTVLQKHDYYRAVMHSFNGSVEQARQVTQRGVKLGFGPAVCNPAARKLHGLIESVDPAHILLETDAPDQPFYDRQGKRNRPVDLCRVNAEIARRKHMPEAELAAVTTLNTQRLFAS
jgi:TatD DNase family protein